MLIAALRPLRVDDVAQLMGLSETLATLNVERYAQWSPSAKAGRTRQAVLAFNGDVYEGLDAPSLGEADLAWAQGHVSILSGLYGLLRPLDRIQPHRLEMGTTLATGRGRNLYEFWGDLLAAQLNRQLKGEPQPILVNLASQEYFRAAQRKVLIPRVIDCVFEDWKDGGAGGGYKVISFFAKRARGLMLRYAITQRIETPEALEGFDAEGYRFEKLVSTPDRLVFRRRVAA